MHPTTRALLVVTDPAQVVGLTAQTLGVLGSDCEVLVLEAEQDSVDLDLAWGTEQPVVHPVTSTDADRESVAGPQPLPEDGATWKAVVEAAERSAADVIVLPQHRSGRLRRLLKGSAVDDVVARASLPVLVLPPLSEAS